MSDFGYGHDNFGRISAKYTATATYAGTTNTKGAWVEIVSSCPSGVNEIIVTMQGADGASSTHLTWLLDVGIGAAGSEVVLIPDIHHHSYDTASGNAVYSRSQFPAAIPAGTRIAIRAQCSHAYACSADIHLLSADLTGARLSRIDAMGVVSSVSAGTQVTCPASGEGSWVEISSSAARAYHKLGLSVINNQNALDLVSLIDIGIGAAASENAVMTDMQYIFRPAISGTHPKGVTWIPITVAQGVRIAARCGFGGGSVNHPRVIIYGAY